MQSRTLLRSKIFQLALVYLCLFTGAVLLIVGFIYWTASDSVLRQIDATIDAEITGLAEQYGQRGSIGLLIAVQRRAEAAEDAGGLYLLTDENFRPLAGNVARWPDETPDSRGWVTFRLPYRDVEGGGINFGRARLFEADGLHLLVGHDVRERTRVYHFIRETLAWGLAAVIAITLLGGMLMSRALLRRIDAINQTSREIIAGDLSRRVAVSGRGDEFDRLAGNLNAMLDQIERLLAAMKQVSDNVAHDLRSPLARLRSRLEVTLMEKPDAAGYRQAIEQTIAEADHLLTTFNALLNIAQAESGAPRRNFEAVDLAAQLRDVMELYEPLAEEKGIDLRIDADQAAGLQGDPHLLFQALANLTDNAIKFSPSGGEVSLSLAREGDWIILTVADHGPGIPAAMREKALERFFRLEESRSTPGSGLGLSLVAAVASLHRGTIILNDNEPGLHAILRLPVTAPPEAKQTHPVAALAVPASSPSAA